MPIGFILTPIDFARFLLDVTDLSPIFLKLVMNLYMVLIDTYRIPIESYRFLNISMSLLIFLRSFTSSS